MKMDKIRAKAAECSDAGICSAYSFCLGAAWAAEEQKKDDIDWACELYEEELRQFKCLLEFTRATAGDVIDVEKSISSFRKKLEGLQ